MQPTAPLAREYALYAAGYSAIGILGLVLDLIRRDHATRSLGPFLVMTVVMLLVLGATNLRWLTTSARQAGAPSPETPIEPMAGTLRRLSLELSLVGLLVLASLAGRVGISALISGLAFGAGGVNLAGRLLVAQLERQRGVVYHRETPRGLVGSGRRPITAHGAEVAED